jgi:hypothetical protein
MPKGSGKPKDKTMTKTLLTPNVAISDIPVLSMKSIINGMIIVAKQLAIEVACSANDLI